MIRSRLHSLWLALLIPAAVLFFHGQASAQAEPEKVITLSHSGFEQAHSVALSPDGKLLAVGGTSGIYLVDTQRFAKTEFIETGVWARAVAFQPGSHTLAAGLFDHSIKFWNVPDAKLVSQMDSPQGWVRSISFSADGTWIASASDDNMVRVWRVKDTAPVLLQDATGVRAVALSPDGSLVAGALGDKTVRVWEVATGRLVYSLSGHEDWVRCLAFSPDGRLLASGSFDKTIRLWNMDGGTLERTLNGHSSSVLGVAFSPDGKTLASGSVDETVRLWNVLDGSQIRVLQGHEGFVYSVAFSPDSGTLASGSGDNTVRLWDMHSLAKADPALEQPVVTSASDCRVCHHRRGQVEPARVIELNCENCHPSGVSSTWCQGFPRSSLVEKTPISYHPVQGVSGVPVNDSKLAVMITSPGNGETLYVRGDFQAPEFVSGKVYRAGSIALSDIEVRLDIISDGETTASLVTNPTETGAFNFNVAINFASAPPHLSRPGTRQCLVCHGDFVPEAGLPKGDVHLVVTATAPEGQQATDNRWIHIDPSGMVQVPLQVLEAETKQPLKGLSIEAAAILYDWRNRFASTTSGADGEAELGLDALSQAETTYTISIPPQVLNGVLYESSAPVKLKLDPASPIQPLTLTARSVTGQIHGGVAGNTSADLNNLDVWAVQLPAGPAYRADLNAQGLFTFDDIPVGRYLVVPEEQDLFRHGQYVSPYAVDLLASPVTNISFSLEHGRMLSGKVMAKDGSPLPFAWVQTAGAIKAINPVTGTFLLDQLPSDTNYVTVSAPGFYTLPQSVKKTTQTLETYLVPRPDLRVINWGNGHVFLPAETKSTVTGSNIDLEYGWIWGRNASPDPLQIDLPGVDISLSSGQFALEKPADGTGWLYVQDGEAQVRTRNGQNVVPLSAGQMIALQEDSKPFPMEPTIVMALHPSLKQPPVFEKIEPTLRARTQNWLVRTGIGAMQTITFITYILSLVTLIAIPALVLFSYWKKRRKSSNSQENH
jgi:hypothetical protein